MSDDLFAGIDLAALPRNQTGVCLFDGESFEPGRRELRREDVRLLRAREPDEDALTVEDLAATAYHCLGINYEKKLMSPGDRPIDIVREAHVRKDLLA